MNKILTKVTALCVGLAMVAGVGVAVGSKKVGEVKADSAQFTLSSASSVTVQTVTASFAKGSGSNAPAWYNAGLRLYASNTVTITATDTISQIDFDWEQQGSKAFASCTANSGSYSHPTNTGTGTWTGSASSVVFTLGSSGQLQLNTFTVTHSGGGVVTNYTITYDSNGGTGTMANTVGPNPAVAACTFTAPEGMRFKEWNDSASGSGASYAVDATPGKDLDLFAIWENKPEGLLIGKDTLEMNDPTASSGYAKYDGDHAFDNVTVNTLDVMVNGEVIQVKKNTGWLHNTTSGGVIKSITLASTENFTIYAGNSVFESRPSSGTAVTNGSDISSSGYEYFAIVSGSNAASTSSIFIEFVNVDPQQETLVVKANGSETSPVEMNYSIGSSLFRAYDENDEDVTKSCEWSISDSSIATLALNSDNIPYVSFVKPGEVTITASKSGYNNGLFVLTINGGALSSITVGGAMTKTSYTTADSWNPGGLTVTANYAYGYSEIVTSDITWNYNPSAPADGVESVVATATYGGKSASSSAQSVTVTTSHAGTADDPFTVAEALAKANEIGAVGNKGQGPWVTKGIITRVTEVPTATYWNATYWISDDGSQENELQVYRGYYIDNAKFDAETALLLTAGKIVTITGNLTGSYGCEYCSGNYMLSLEDKPTGDIDVTFEPATSIEIGDTGTFTASTSAANPTYTWSVEDSSILSVNESTGAFEGLALGTTKVTVNVSSSAGSGVADAYITVNDDYGNWRTVDEANEIAGSLDSGKTTPYYIYIRGFVSKFNSDSQSAGNERAFSIVNTAESEEIIVFVGKSGYSSFVEGLQIGTSISLKAYVQNFNGTPELQSPVNMGTEYVAMTFSAELLELTDAVCEDYDGITDNKAAIEAFWSSLETKYDGMTDLQHSILVDPTTYGAGNTVKNAMARYDYLVAKYDLDHFINGRSKITLSNILNFYEYNSVDSSSSIAIIIIVAVASMTLLGTTLVIRKRKHQ